MPLARAIASASAAGMLALFMVAAAPAQHAAAQPTAAQHAVAQPTSAQHAAAQPAAAQPTVAQPASALGSVSPIGTTVGAVRAGVNDFSFASFDAEYKLGRDADGHATLTTTETIVAEFPQFDQNHGIKRLIPTTIDGHPTDVHIVSVTDGAGHPRSYETDDDDDGIALKIAAKNFVHGTQTYVITYTEKNVIHYPDDADDDEFYRDINGTGWAQQFGTVTGSLHVSASLAAHLTGQIACYQGVYGSTASCNRMQTSASGSDTVITATGTQLGPHGNVTMVVGFREGTFTPRDNSFFASWAAIPMIGTALLGVIALIASIVTRRTAWRNAPGRPTIIAEYQAPGDLDLLMAGRLVKASGRKSVVAGILDLAVRGILRMLEREDDRGKKKFSLKLSQESGLASADRSLAHAVFGGIKRGIRQDLYKRSPELGKRITKLLSTVPARARSEGYERSTKGKRKNILVIVGLVAAVGGVVPCVAMISQDYGEFWPLILLLIGVVFGVGAVIVASTSRPLTARGAEARDHLAGLKLYIELAEADRMRLLQSPDGALRSSTPVTDEEVLRLNERLLPYAVLFKRDKEWMRVLGKAYEQAGTSPTWYDGSGAFTAAALAASISSFNASSSWSGSSSNSSSSGFSGGGFSGGGGGGGGGGGV
jgi:uncharacterized membrane protein YgcG